jgi:hypothetical protein
MAQKCQGRSKHVLAVQRCRPRLVIRSVGLARATARLGLANLVTNMRRLVWFATPWCHSTLAATRRARVQPAAW